MTSVSDIRQGFIDFFVRHGHQPAASSALVPHNDPTLMFTNAGMNQFKNIFTGAEKAPSPPRAVTAQKVVRAGGKHNDLENVGYTTRHHTFFEMMGNFSFGDYFKQDAIAYAWELLTKDFVLDKDRLYFTVYHTDDEAFAAWKKVTGCDDSRILRIPTTDNFWSMGDTGPCGPCSEIFYDHGEGLSGEWKLDATGHDLFDARYVEIWNLVFMQYEQQSADQRINLPKPCVDTGMGLERMATVLQGKTDNYQIDLFQTIIQAIEVQTQVKANVSHRVIADHLRACGFLIADGVMPSNEGRGYVLRRIMRRAMRHAHLLGAKDPLMHRLVPVLLQTMGAHYQELGRAEALIKETLKTEEERFKQTLDRGLKLLDEARASLSAGDRLDGAVAFKLYDTFGFPLDLTQDILRADKQDVDVDGFNAAMAEQKARARAAWSGSGEAAVQTVWFDLKEQYGSTEFIGYQHEEAEAVITALLKDGAPVDTLNAGESGIILTNQTPCYAESGGQQGDEGEIYIGAGLVAHISNTTKPIDGLHAHHVTIAAGGQLKAAQAVRLKVNHTRRSRLRANHSATHLLNAALRRHLGEHVVQKGSLVAEDKLRFDISHPRQISREELAAVELEVNRLIRQNSCVTTRLMEKDAAIAAGAIAMFGEKYDDEVRVLMMGEDAGQSYSVELCGGTHVSRTGDIALFKIISEGAVAAGIRRIEALTGEAALDYLLEQEQRLKEVAAECNVKPEDILVKLQKMNDERKQLEKQLAEAKKKLAMGGSGGDDAMSPQAVGSVQFIGKSFDALPPKELRDLVTSLSQQYPAAVVALASENEGKASVIVAIGADAKSPLDAPALVKIAVPVVGGQGGGGKPNFAQCGGPDGAQASAAIEAIKAALAA